MISIKELTIDQVHAAFKSGEYTCHQLTQAYISRIEALDQTGTKLNAITIISHLALTEASAIDEYYKKHGQFVGPLHGVPVIVKDQCDTKDVQTAYGNICCKHIPTEDATLVRRLRDAGAVILAKSTMPDFAASYNSASSLSGLTLNPYDLTRESGGSSAGTGTALAANYGLIGVGEDTGGSIRVPASFCNLVGLRPTVGLVSRAGLSPLVKTQDTPGPMARTVRDVALMLDVLVGYDAKDPYTTAALIVPPPAGGSYAANLLDTTLAKSRIGVLKQLFGPETDPECASVNKVIRSTLSQLEDSTTARFIDIEIPNLDHYIAFTPTYLSRSRSDIDDFLSSHPQLASKNLSISSLHSSNNFHPALPLFNKLGTTYTSPYDDPLYAQRLIARDEFQNLVMGIMADNKLDAIAYPSVQIPAPKLEDVLGDKFRGRFPTNTGVASQTRMPAISVPAGWTEGGLPVGLELLGLPYSEQKLLELALGVEMVMRARTVPPF